MLDDDTVYGCVRAEVASLGDELLRGDVSRKLDQHRSNADLFAPFSLHSGVRGRRRARSDENRGQRRHHTGRRMEGSRFSRRILPYPFSERSAFHQLGGGGIVHSARLHHFDEGG